MKLKWIDQCTENGVWLGKELHYWDEEEKQWVQVPYDSCKSWEYEEYVQKENYWL